MSGPALRHILAAPMLAMQLLAGRCPSPPPPPPPPPGPPASSISFDDRIQIELTDPLDPDDALNLPGLVSSAKFGPLASLALSFHVRLQSSVSAALAKQLGLTKLYTVRFPHDVSASVLNSVLSALNAVPVVKKASLVPKPKPPSDPFVDGSGKAAKPCGIQWSLKRIHADDAWACGATGAGVVVAVIDWGFVLDHVEFTEAFDMSHAYNACNPSSTIGSGPDADHGTGSVGIVAARQNSVGIQGVAFNTTVWPVQAAPCPATSTAADPWADAVANVIDSAGHDRRVVILLEVESAIGGNYEGDDALNTVVAAAVQNGVVVVVPAGNGDRDAGIKDDGKTPIANTGSVVVAATTDSPNERWSGSNFGDRVDVAAPGDPDSDLTATSEKYKCDPAQTATTSYRVSGFGCTSGAAARVAGVAALMLQKDPSLTPEAVRHLLQENGTVINQDPLKPIGGLVNAAAAVKAADPQHCP